MSVVAVIPRIDQIDNYDKQELLRERTRIQNMSIKDKRDRMIQTDAEKKKELEDEQKRTTKDLGASRDTIHTIGNIAADRLHFMQLCGEWNTNSSNIRRNKVAYERLVSSEKLTLSPVMEEAWRHRPVGCTELRKAINIRARYYLDMGQVKGKDTKLPKEFKPMYKRATKKQKTSATGKKTQSKPGAGAAGAMGSMVEMTQDDIDERVNDLRAKEEGGTISEAETKELLKLDPPDTTIRSQLDSLLEAIHKLNAHRDNTRLDQYFPGHGGFREQQAASEQVTILERRLGGAMDQAEKLARWPCLADGWSKCPKRMAKLAMDKKLGFELEIEQRQRRDKEGRESPSILKAKAADEALAQAARNEKARAKGPTPEAGGYEGAEADTFNRLFDEDGVEDEDEDLSAINNTHAPLASEERLATAPFEEGLSGDEEEDDGAGVMPRAPKIHGISNMQMQSIWAQATGDAGGFYQEQDDSDGESATGKKRKLEVEGGTDSDVEDDDERECDYGY